MATPELRTAQLRQELSRASLIRRYREILRRLESLLIRSAQEDRSAKGTRAVSDGTLFSVSLKQVRLWVEADFAPVTLERIQPAELHSILEELVLFLAPIDLLRQASQSSERLPQNAALLAGPAVLESWALAVLHVLEKIDAGDTIIPASATTPLKAFDGFAVALATWIIEIPFQFQHYRTVLSRRGLSLQKSDALRAFRSFVIYQRRLIEWRDSRDPLPRYESVRRLYNDPRSVRFLPILRSADHSQLTKIDDRAEFYAWVYDLFADLGHEVRWPLAATIVARNAGAVASVPVEGWTSFGSVDNRLQAFMRIGNQVIFDDVLAKLSRLFLEGLWRGPLTDENAVEWDAVTLSEEQHLVQTLYDINQPDSVAVEETIEDLYDLAHKGVIAFLGAPTTEADTVAEGPYNRAGDVPAFQGTFADFKTPRGRWDYGNLLASLFSTLDVPPRTTEFPTPSPQYTNGSRLNVLNVRPHLHWIDALLDDADADEAEILRVLKLCTESERKELRGDQNRLKQLRDLDDSDVDAFLDELRSSEE